MEKLFKYELQEAVVKYLINAVNAQQVRGESQAQDLVAVLNLLRKPKNAEDMEKETLENLKAKYEPVTEKKEEK